MSFVKGNIQPCKLSPATRILFHWAHKVKSDEIPSVYLFVCLFVPLSRVFLQKHIEEFLDFLHEVRLLSVTGIKLK